MAKLKTARGRAKKTVTPKSRPEDIEQRRGDSDGGDQPCQFCLRNPSRRDCEWFDMSSGRYVCDMCSLSRYGKV